MKASKNGLFLMEMILVVLLFSISAAICVQMFGYANQTANRAQNLSQATLVARSVAECYQSTQGDMEKMAAILEGTQENNQVTVIYDEQWQTSPGQGIYKMTATMEGNLVQIIVEKLDNSQEIYRLETRIPGGAAR